MVQMYETLQPFTAQHKLEVRWAHFLLLAHGVHYVWASQKLAVPVLTLIKTCDGVSVLAARPLLNGLQTLAYKRTTSGHHWKSKSLTYLYAKIKNMAFLLQHFLWACDRYCLHFSSKKQHFLPPTLWSHVKVCIIPWQSAAEILSCDLHAPSFETFSVWEIKHFWQQGQGENKKKCNEELVVDVMAMTIMKMLTFH